MPTMDATRDFGPSTMPTISELDRDLLHPGARVGGCQILEPIAQDDGGILYVVDDALLQRHVLVREHFPQGLAARGDVGEVLLVSGHDPSAREAALARFLRGARWLTRFDHPSIGRALRVWEERGTAYLMMPLYEGESLAAAQRHAGWTDETKLRALLGALCDALAPMHAAGVFHLGLSPDSIWVQPDGRPVLFDLSYAAPAAQRTVSDSVDRQFAPIELFGHGSAFPVGAWTDIYSLGAVMHHALLGRPPLSAAVLGPNDIHAPLSEGLARRGPGRATAPLPSAALIAAIERALAVRPENRPQDLDAFRRLLGLEAPAVVVAPLVAAPVPAQAPAAPRPEPPVLTSLLPPAPVRPAADTTPAEPPAPAAEPEVTPNNSPETEVDAAAAAAIAMAVSSLPWANEREPALSAEPPGFKPQPGRNVPREPSLGPQKFVMPAPAKRKAVPRKPPGRFAAALFGLVACAGMAGWYVVENPGQVAAWLGVPATEPAAAPAPRTATATATATPAPPPTPTPGPAPVEAVLANDPPAAGPTPTPAPVAIEPPAPAAPAAEAAPPPAPAPVAVVEPPPKPKVEPKRAPRKQVAAATPADEPDAPPANNPKAACGTRSNFALFRCMETQCGLQRFSRHPQCIQFRAENRD